MPNSNAVASPVRTDDVEARTLARLLSTPPQPKTKTDEKDASTKKRGRPPKSGKD